MKKEESNNDMKTHEIQLEGEYAKILISILDKHGIKYINNQNNNIFVFDIYEKDIVNIYNILKYERIGDGIDPVTKGFNDYGRKVDDLLSEFSRLGAKLKKEFVSGNWEKIQSRMERRLRVTDTSALLEKRNNMVQSIDYKKYRYFYDLGIVRMDRKTGNIERFIHGKFEKTTFNTDIEKRLNDGFDNISELREDSPGEFRLLKEELNISRTQ
jgi:hypothetical protein